MFQASKVSLYNTNLNTGYHKKVSNFSNQTNPRKIIIISLAWLFYMETKILIEYSICLVHVQQSLCTSFLALNSDLVCAYFNFL